KFESKFKLILVPNYGVHLEWSGCKRDRKLQLNPFAGTQLAGHCAANSTQADILRPTGEAGGGTRGAVGERIERRAVWPGLLDSYASVTLRELAGSKNCKAGVPGPKKHFTYHQIRKD